LVTAEPDGFEGFIDGVSRKSCERPGGLEHKAHEGKEKASIVIPATASG
jgi:hypothetical protein